MRSKNSRRLMLAASVAAASAIMSPAALAIAPGALSSHHTQYYYSNDRAPCTTRGVAAVPGACNPLGGTVISYRPIAAAATTYTPLFGGLLAPWSRPVVAPFAPAPAVCPPACVAPPQPVCCNVLRLVPVTCYRTTYCREPVVVHQSVTTYDPCSGCPITVLRPTTTYRLVARRVPYTKYCLRVVRMCSSPTAGYASGNYATGNCATGNYATGSSGAGLVLQDGEPHEVTRIVVPQSPVNMPPEHEIQNVPTEAMEKESDAEQKPADASPASMPRLTNPRDRLTMVPIRRIVGTSHLRTDTGWQATAR